jgi:hypothetical protein
MAEVIRERVVERPAAEHHYHEGSARSNNFGFIIGLILVLALLYLLFVYGLPMIRTAATPNIAVPERVDVNVNTPAQPGQ